MRFFVNSKLAIASAVSAALCSTDFVLAGQYTITKTADTVIDSRGLVLDDAVDGYGIGINGNSFESSAIQTYNGWQYAAYWVKNGSAYHAAIARRQTGAATWQIADLTNSVFTNGLNGTRPSDAHNVVSFGIDQTDGTIHLAYDLHGHNLKYRVSNQGVATNPNSISQAQWTQSLFGAQTAQLVTGTTVGGVTYPHFFNKPTGGLQFTYRTGSSGNGSNWLADYNGTTHAWGNVHQYDNGATGTYTGTVTVNDANRNSYINGATYGPTGRLYQSFTWREGATGAANHDINFVYSDDNGNTWKNNAGTTVASQSANTRFNLNSPGLVVVPMSESMSLMNQQAQAVSSNDKFHTLMWHRDTAKTAIGSSTVWDPVQSSYFDYWRDSLGNFHRNKLPGAVGQRPKILFDASDNAIAIYQAGAFSSGGLYINAGDLIIAAATKASNWTDWKIIKTEAGPFVSETQADAALLKLTGNVLSVVMQVTPGVTTPAQGTNMRALDYTINLVPAVDRTLNATGTWGTSGNWSGSTVPTGNANAIIGSGRTASLSTTATTLDNSLVIGSGGGAGTFNLGSGGSLTIGASVIVGRDSNSVGTYNQTGGSLSSWRFVVGDYFNETSGGGASSANVSGGTLTTSELQVAASANGSSNNSSFNVSGTANVTINGEVIIADCGSIGTVQLDGGAMTVLGDLREGYNGNNTSTLRVNGGTLNMTGNTISVDNLEINGGVVSNASFNALTGTGGIVNRTDGATATLSVNSGNYAGSIQDGNGVLRISKLTSGTLTLAGANNFSGGVILNDDAGAILVTQKDALGSGVITIGNGGSNKTGVLKFAGGINVTSVPTINFASRFTSTASGSATIENVSGNNSIDADFNINNFGGNSVNILSTAGKLTLKGNLSSTGLSSARGFNFYGAGDGEVSGNISDGTAYPTFVQKDGAGTWTLSGLNTYTSTTTINAGKLVVNGTHNKNVPYTAVGSGSLEVGASGFVAVSTLNSVTAITNAGTLTASSGGAIGGVSGTGTFNITGGAIASASGIQQNTLNISNGAAITIATNGGATGVTKVKSLNIATNGASFDGKIDLKDNDLIIDYTGGATNYAAVLARVKKGLVSLGGNGTGIASSTVDAQTIPGTMLGVVDNATVGGIITSLSGVAAPMQSVLVKFTWVGDANLDGVVDGTDYALIDSGFASGGGSGGWAQGDFNYSNSVDGTDYALIDSGFGSQSGALPEPTMIGLLGLGAIGLLRRSRLSK